MVDNMFLVRRRKPLTAGAVMDQTTRVVHRVWHDGFGTRVMGGCGWTPNGGSRRPDNTAITCLWCVVAR